MNNESNQSDPSRIASQSVDSIIRESQSAIGQGMAKRGRGRPRKDATAGASNGSPGTGNAVNSLTPQGQPQTASPIIEIPTQLLEPLVSFPFNMAKGRTGFDGWSLSKEEAEVLAKQTDLVIRQYMPVMNSPHAAAYTLAGTMLCFAGVRYMMYLDWKNLEREKMEKLKQVTSG